MISHDIEQPERTTIYIDIEEESYFNGRKVNELALPTECTLVDIIRNKKSIPILPSLKIIKGDQIGIEINSKDIEQLYRSLISLGS
jgi:Trk K+ transport system NAD-binding subunit